MTDIANTYQRFETSVSLGEIIDRDLEGFLDLLAELVGKPLLMDINYGVQAVNPDGTLLLWVTGDTSECDDDE